MSTQINKPRLSPTPRLHFLGIGGSGMAPLAELAFLNGYKVSGSDSTNSEKAQYLKRLGINITIGNSSQNIEHTESNTTVVYSSAIKENNSELMEAILRKLPLLHRSDLLHFFISQKSNSITVAGTHGKSTTSSMIAFLLHQLGQDPSSIIGAKLKSFSSLALNGKSEYIVAEADESDGTLIKYEPYVAVLTSVDFDHMDFYRDHDHILETYEKYLSNIHKDGWGILNFEDPYCYELSHSLKIKKLSYGFSVSPHLYVDIQGSNYSCKNAKSSFSVNFNKIDYKAGLNLIGKHNSENALATYACGVALGFKIKDCIESLESFPGVKRRLECIYKSKNVILFDDYAHNPTKIQSVLNALRTSSPSSKVIAIFQPHRHSRIKSLYNKFVGTFSDANLVYVLPIYSSGEHDDHPIPSETIALDIERTSHVPAVFVENFEKAKESIVESITSDSIIITLGAGDVWQLAQTLKERLS